MSANKSARVSDLSRDYSQPSNSSKKAIPAWSSHELILERLILPDRRWLVCGVRNLLLGVSGQPEREDEVRATRARVSAGTGIVML